MTGKKGNTDVTWMFLIVGIMVTSALAIPLISRDLSSPVVTYNVNGTVDDAVDEVSQLSSANPFTIMQNIYRMVFWDPADALDLHWSVHLIFDVMAIIFIFLTARLIRGTG